MNSKPIKIYKNLYFDIDRTLWDLKSNSELTLSQLIERHTPQLTPRFKEFLTVFNVINEGLWLQYRDGEIKKEYLQSQRFGRALSKMGVDDSVIAKQFGDDFMREAPLKTGLFPHTLEVLEYLKNKGYRMFLITNGFTKVQEVKIRESKLEGYFDKMITSESVGCQKPNKKIFEYALKCVNAKKSESIMIGDDLENDIAGAKHFGMDTVLFNPEKTEHSSCPTFEISCLSELNSIF